MPLLLSPTLTLTGVKCGALGLGAGAVSKHKNTYKPLSVSQGTPLLSDGNVTANNKGKTMETSTGELIAKLTNLSNKLEGEMRFVESDLVLEAVAYMHSMSKMAEVIRHANYTDTRSQLNNVVRFITGTNNE